MTSVDYYSPSLIKLKQSVCDKKICLRSVLSVDKFFLQHDDTENTEGLEIKEIGYLWNKANSFVFLQIEPIKDIVPSAKHSNL